MEISGFPAGPYKTNCYIVSDNGRAFVVDPGMHAFDRVVSAAADYTLEAIYLTHGHFDHTRCAGDLAQRFNIPVYIHAADEMWLHHTDKLPSQMQALFDVKNMVPIADLRTFGSADSTTPSDETLDFLGKKFNAIHAPGHSPGCAMLVNEEVAFSGDVLFHGSIGRTDLPFSDPVAMQRSLAGPVWQLADELAVLPGHGPTSTMAHERATNPFLVDLKR